MSFCVWYVSKYVVTPSLGEAAGREYGLLREFARRGHKAVIVTSDSLGMAKNAPFAQQEVVFQEMEGVILCRIHTLQYSASKSLRRILSWLDFELKLLRLPTKSLPEPDVIVVSSLSLLTVLNGLRMRRRYACRLIFEIRDIWPLTITDVGGFSPHNPLVILLGAVERLGYRRADAIVGTMPNLGPHVAKVAGRARPTYCIPMGVDPDEIELTAPLPAEYAQTYLPRDKFLVGYAGSLGLANAMDVFFQCVEVMGEDADVHFVVVGDGDLRESYVSLYAPLPNLTFGPKIPKAMIPDLLRRCDLLFVALADKQIYEYGQSLNKLIDYMLAAKPIVASYSGYRSMINEAECGTFVPAGDVLALRDEIRRFAAMTAEQREAMGKRGRAWVLENRDYGMLADQYLQVLSPDVRSDSPGNR